MLPSNGTYDAPSDGWCGAWLTPGLLAYSPLMCRMYNHNCREDIFWQLPEELNEVQFAVEFGEYETKVASRFNYLLYQRLLSMEVRLIFKDTFVAASIWNTFLGTFPMQTVLVETTLSENCFNALWKIWVFQMRSGIYHGLVDFAAILYKPGIMHVRLLSTGVDIHASGHQSILCICGVSLRVINKD